MRASATFCGAVAPSERPVRWAAERTTEAETFRSIEIACEYFARMRARDLSVADLFRDDGELLGLGARRRGREANLDFYGGIIHEARPTPRQVGPLLAEGDRVGAEMLIELPGGATVHAVDLFWIEGGFIALSRTSSPPGNSRRSRRARSVRPQGRVGYRLPSPVLAARPPSVGLRNVDIETMRHSEIRPIAAGPVAAVSRG